MIKTPDTDTVFNDLQDAYLELQAKRNSPKDIRRCFNSYVNLAERLSKMMAKECSRQKGKRWEVTDFKNWNIPTDFLHKLRNETEHDHQIYIAVCDRRFYRTESLGDNLIVIEGTWVDVDQMADIPPEGVELVHTETLIKLDQWKDLLPKGDKFIRITADNEQFCKENISLDHVEYEF